jgi:hypothetical protein
MDMVACQQRRVSVTLFNGRQTGSNLGVGVALCVDEGDDLLELVFLDFSRGGKLTDDVAIESSNGRFREPCRASVAPS